MNSKSKVGDCIKGIVHKGESKVWSTVDRHFTLIQRGEELNYEGEYLFLVIRYSIDGGIRIVKPICCILNNNIDSFFQKIVANKRLTAGLELFRLVYALSIGKLTLKNVEKEQAVELYKKMCNFNSLDEPEKVKEFYEKEPLLNVIGKELYQILTSCDRSITEEIACILNASQDVSDIDFEVVSESKLVNTGVLPIEDASKLMAYIEYTNLESDISNFIKATNNEEHCLNYKVKLVDNYFIIDKLYDYNAKLYEFYIKF